MTTPSKGMSFRGVGSLHWVHWIVVTLSLVLTLVAWHISKTQIEEKTLQRFDGESRQVMELITERMSKYEDALWAGVATIHSQSNGIDYLEWQRFAETLHIEDRYPGINGIGVIYYVPEEERTAFLQREHMLRPEFSIFPPHDQGEYWPITYIEPLKTNAKALGLDMAHEVNRLTAAKKARDTGTAQITAPIVLVQDAEKTPGFLFYAPYYTSRTRGQAMTPEQRQEEFVGVVYAPFIAHKLMEGALESQKRLVNITIRDGDTILFDENIKTSDDYDPSPLYTQHYEVEMYGRPWVIDVSSSAVFRQITENNQPVLILLGGVIIDGLLLTLFIFLARSKQRAVSYAAQMTVDLEHEKIHLQTIMDSVVDGIIVIDHKGIIRSVNPSVERVFQYNAKELLGKNVSVLMPAPYRAEHDGYLNNYVKTRHAKIIGIGREVEGKRKDDTIFPLELSVNEMVANGEPMFVGTIRDITERKTLMERLVESNTELERFAYVASHDLQEPLRMITNFGEIIAEDYAEVLDEEGRQNIQFVIDSSHRMRDMVNDLLEYSRLAGESARMVRFSGEDTLRDVLDNLANLIAQSGAKITHDALPDLEGNPLQIMRLLQNLIVNAIKYQPKDNVPLIHVGLEDRKSHWCILVKDNGLGIQEDFVQHIFHPFRRLHNWSDIKGTGLGLSICKKIVENHGGEIWVISKPGAGSTMCFTLTKHYKNEQDDL